MSAQEQQRYIFGLAQDNMRFDKALSELAEGLTRSRVQNLIKDGCVELNGITCTDSARKVLNGEVASLIMPQAQEAEPQPENIPLDIVYEDDDLIVINKSVGLVVHPGAGNWSGTLVNALLYHCGDTLSGIGGVIRPGIVHRLDKDTSGLLVVAKNDAAHNGLAAQLEDRSLSRVYKALVLNVPTPIKGVVDMPIGRDKHNRLKMAVRSRGGGKEARTHYLVKENYKDSLALVECALESGRTHQIRVHMQFLKSPLIGDALYGPQVTALQASMSRAGYSAETIEACKSFPRQALHAQKISFLHPATDEHMEFESDLPEDLSNILKLLN